MAYSHFQDHIHPKIPYTEQRYTGEKQGDGCYLFIMFPSYGEPDVGKACVLSKRTAMTQGGRLIGLAKKVFSSGFETKTDEGCVVYYFPNRQSAVMFFQTDTYLKQPDFPQSAGHCQAWIIDRAYTPYFEQGYNTFMVSEIRLKRPNCVLDYKSKYATPLAELLQKYNAQPYVVQTTDCLGLRRFCKDREHLVTIHIFPSLRSLDAFMKDPEYDTLQCVHMDQAFEMCTYFTLDPRPCP